MSTRTIRQNYLFQIICWMLAANLYMIARFIGLSDFDQLHLSASVDYYKIFTQATLGGVAVGIILGTIDIFLSRQELKQRSFKFIVITKGILYFMSIVLVIAAIRIITDLFFEHRNVSETMSDLFLFFEQGFLLSMLTCALFVCFLINFIRQVNQKFGPGIMIPMFLGKYYKPKQEERIFMFLDLRDSTTHAEKIGDLKYSEMMQDCFYDLATQVEKHEAEIYQYVGDEVVLNWKLKSGIKDFNCVKIFFAFEERLKTRSNYYQWKYGVVPVFKAGVNGGHVIVAEIGEIKKDIAYHGDVLNTAQRIQSQCNAFGKNLLISEFVFNQWTSNGDSRNGLRFSSMGSVDLKGKLAPVNIYSVEERTF